MKTLDVIKRTAFNSTNDVIAVQYVNISVETLQGLDSEGASLETTTGRTTKRFLRMARIGVPKTVRSISSVSRVVTKVVTNGNFDTVAVVSNDVTTATYTGATALENDVVIPLNKVTGLIRIGDTV